MSDSRITPELRRQVEERARNCCEYCRCPSQFSESTFEVEHIFPRCEGGKSQLDNLASACSGCNGHKSTRTVGRDIETGQLAPLFHPRKQLWREHFAWSADATLIVGLTPTGRATVEELRMNRKGLVNLRRLLRDAGLHPPKDP